MKRRLNAMTSTLSVPSPAVPTKSIKHLGATDKMLATSPDSDSDVGGDSSEWSTAEMHALRPWGTFRGLAREFLLPMLGPLVITVGWFFAVKATSWNGGFASHIGVAFAFALALIAHPKAYGVKSISTAAHNTTLVHAAYLVAVLLLCGVAKSEVAVAIWAIGALLIVLSELAQSRAGRRPCRGDGRIGGI